MQRNVLSGNNMCGEVVVYVEIERYWVIGQRPLGGGGGWGVIEIPGCN